MAIVTHKDSYFLSSDRVLLFFLGWLQIPASDSQVAGTIVVCHCILFRILAKIGQCRDEHGTAPNQGLSEKRVHPQ